MNMKTAPIQSVELFTLPRIHNNSGTLTAIEGLTHIPFAIERVFYLYNVPDGAKRGGHAHHTLHQLIIAAAGSFDVIVDNGRARSTFSLNRSYLGLYIPPLHWQDLVNFSTGAVCLVLTSAPYDESDYIRNHETFAHLITGDLT